MHIQAIKTRVFKEREPLINFIVEHIPPLAENSILIVTSKIVALSEGRTVATQNMLEKEALIRFESEKAVQTKYCWFTIKNHMIMANAGIDESNSNNRLVLLPKDCYQSAEKLRQNLKKHYKIKNLGIIITDSHITPLTAGVIGCALGYAGFQGLHDYRGTSDIFGKKMKMTQTNIAHSIAPSATLLMGEGNEQKPLALVTAAPVEFCNRNQKNKLVIKKEDDMYWPLFEKLFQNKSSKSTLHFSELHQ